MPDRIVAILVEPRDDALPVDVQAVGLRRKAIELMQEAADINESSVRYRGGGDDMVILLDNGVQLSMWQLNTIAARFIADGKAHKDICGPVIRQDHVRRTYSSVSLVRDEFN